MTHEYQPGERVYVESGRNPVTRKFLTVARLTATRIVLSDNQWFRKDNEWSGGVMRSGPGTWDPSAFLYPEGHPKFERAMAARRMRLRSDMLTSEPVVQWARLGNAASLEVAIAALRAAHARYAEPTAAEVSE